MNANLKESRKSLRSSSSKNFTKKSRQREFEPNKCKVHNAKIVSEDIETGTRGANPNNTYELP